MPVTISSPDKPVPAGSPVTGVSMPRRPRHLAGSVAASAPAATGPAVGRARRQRPRHAATRAGRRRALPLSGLLLLVAVAASASNPPAPALAAPASLADCLARSGRTQVSRILHQAWRADRTPDDHTYDLRRATSIAYGRSSNYPLLFGKARAGTNLCVLGGHVIGQQPRALTYQAVYTRYNGDGMWVQGRGSYLVRGFRAENVEDGISLQGGDGDFAVVSGAYLSYVRDDCIENDHIVGGRVEDSLFDGCFMGISERPDANAPPSRAPAGETFTLDRTLIRIAPQANERAADGAGNGQLFKWSDAANRLVLRDSVFLVEEVPIRGYTPLAFPAGTTAQNVTLVWLGAGAYPGPLPRGVTVVRNRAVWDTARANSARHPAAVRQADPGARLQTRHPPLRSNLSAETSRFRSRRRGHAARVG